MSIDMARPMAGKGVGNGERLLVLYDGLCGLCNRLVQFLLRRDRKDQFRFAPQQSAFARKTLEPHGINSAALNTVCVVIDFGSATETVLTKASAVLHMVICLGGFWRIASVLRIVPRALADAIYDLVTRRRYHIFGKRDSCYLPDEDDRRKFQA